MCYLDGLCGITYGLAGSSKEKGIHRRKADVTGEESLHRSLAGTQNEPCGLLRAPPVFTKEECYYCSYGAAVNNAGSTATGSAV
ncbi:unnamed protein product [Gadus morhua 'NCC']